MQIIDDFLPKEYFNRIKKIIIHPDFPLFFNENVSGSKDEPDSFYFTHTIYNHHKPNSLIFFEMQIILDKLQIEFLSRIKINCYPRTESLITHHKHFDSVTPHKGCILSLNTCNGGTFIGDNFIPSIENRAVLFDPSQLHQSTNCTDKKARYNININYK